MIIHHDDPPCDLRLDASGKCPKCQLVPDTQSTQLAEPWSKRERYWAGKRQARLPL